jgi:hypothetical protein
VNRLEGLAYLQFRMRLNFSVGQVTRSIGLVPLCGATAAEMEIEQSI